MTTPYTINAVVGYDNGKVIVKQDDGLFFFIEMPDNILLTGETVHPNDLTPINVLSKEEQKYIKTKYATTEV